MARHKTLAPTSANPAATPHQAARTSRSKAPSPIGDLAVGWADGEEVVRSAEIVGFTIVAPFDEKLFTAVDWVEDSISTLFTV